MSFRSPLCAIFVFSVHCTLSIHAESPTVSMVVTPDRIERERTLTANAVSVITAEELQRKGITTVAEALRAIPGVDVVRSGGLGGNTAIFMRGANSEHTLLLIDGVEANNPASPTRAFNFSDLSVDEIERIEVLRGPQSTLYGSDAIGGVIQIITKRAAIGTTLEGAFEGGSYNHYVEQIRSGYGSDLFSINLGGSRKDFEGFSAADSRDGNSEDDGFEESSFAGRAEVKPLDWLVGTVSLRSNNSRAEIDNEGGARGDDPNRRVNNEELFFRSEVKAALFDNSWEPSFGFSYADHLLKDDNDPDPTHPLDSLRSRYDGEFFSYTLQNNFAFNDMFSAIVGVETEQEKASSHYHSTGEFGPFDDVLDSRSAYSQGYFTEVILNAGDLFSSTFGARIDDHSKFGTQTTWRVAPVLNFKESGTALKATAGTGYKAPSLVQLYSSYGNPDLNAEESVGFDLGIEQNLFSDLIQAEARMFWNSFDNLITFNPSTFILENIEEARSRGIETSLRARILEDLSSGVSWTYTDSEDESTNLPLLRRARNKLALELNYRVCEKSQITLSTLAIGARADNDFSTYPPTRETLAGYVVMNIAASLKINEHIEATFRVENLFDKNYQEVLGYGTTGAAVFGGVRLKL